VVNDVIRGLISFELVAAEVRKRTLALRANPKRCRRNWLHRFKTEFVLRELRVSVVRLFMAAERALIYHGGTESTEKSETRIKEMVFPIRSP
jgi:hypothetical protein